MISPAEGWAVGLNGTILHYNQGGWQLASSPVSQDLKDIDMGNEGEGWAVGSKGVIVHYINNRWQEVTSPTNRVLTAIDIVNENEGWAVGFKGTILQYRDGSWFQTEPITDQDLLEIDMINESEGWILGVRGNERIILRYQNNTWRQVVHTQEYSLYAMDMLSANEGQGCSVLKKSDIIKDVIKVHTVVKEFKANIFDFVFSQNIEGKTPQLSEDVRISANRRFVFPHCYVAHIMICIFNAPMMADGLTECLGAQDNG